MPEYFIVSNSFAAPFFSDTDTGFVTAENPDQALEKFAKEYTHPCGLYSAVLFASSDDYHKGKPALAKWVCNHELEKQRATKDLGSYSFLGHEPGKFEINGTLHTVEDPKGGQIVRTNL